MSPTAPCGEIDLSASGLDRLFAGCEAATLLLAVSGGPDSMALMHLAARWAAGGRPGLAVATVDHGLRRGSAAEAAHVAAAAARLGLPHATLRWAGAKPATRLQERARAARYALLAGHARALGAAFVLTGHHADDQAETVLMRLGAGSGVAGLRGMRRATPLAPGVTLLRPLLDLPKAALVALCRRQGEAVVSDPSNADLSFARARLRRGAAEAASLGLGRDALLRLARRMARAEAALEAEAARLEARLAPRQGPGEWHAGLGRPGEQPQPEILGRLLRRAVEHAVGKAEQALAGEGGVAAEREDEPFTARPLRLARLEALADALHAALAGGRPLSATLGGARILLSGQGELSVVREKPRRRGRLHRPADTPSRRD